MFGEVSFWPLALLQQFPGLGNRFNLVGISKAQIILFHQNPAVIFLQTKERSHPSPAGTNLADLAGDLVVSREVLKGNEQFISFFVMQANGYDSVAPNRKRFVGTNAMQAYRLEAGVEEHQVAGVLIGLSFFASVTLPTF